MNTPRMTADGVSIAIASQRSFQVHDRCPTVATSTTVRGAGRPGDHRTVNVRRRPGGPNTTVAAGAYVGDRHHGPLRRHRHPVGDEISAPCG